MKIELRKYKPNDGKVLAELFYNTVHSVNAKDYLQEQLDVWATGMVRLEDWNTSFLENHTVIAVSGKEIVGFGDMDKTGYLDRLYVHKDYQRQGVAKAIYTELETSCAALKFITHASITAKPFFENMGYRVVKEQEVERGKIKLKNYVMERRNENTPKLDTKRLILRRFSKEDVNAFFLLMNDEEVNTFLPVFPLKNQEEAQAFLQEHYLEAYSKRTSYRYAICLKSDNLPIGYMNIGEDDSHDLGYALRKEFWHMGIVSEAAAAVAECIEASGISYITATHDIKNPRSGEVMKKIGMTYRYSYEEQWQPKNFPVVFRMYQLDFDGETNRTYKKYWEKYPVHFVEENIK